MARGNKSGKMFDRSKNQAVLLPGNYRGVAKIWLEKWGVSIVFPDGAKFEVVPRKRRVNWKAV